MCNSWATRCTACYLLSGSEVVGKLLSRRLTGDSIDQLLKPPSVSQLTPGSLCLLRWAPPTRASHALFCTNRFLWSWNGQPIRKQPGCGASPTAQPQMAGCWGHMGFKRDLGTFWGSGRSRRSASPQESCRRDCRFSTVHGPASHPLHLGQGLLMGLSGVFLPPLSSSSSEVKFLCNPGSPVLTKTPIQHPE